MSGSAESEMARLIAVKLFLQNSNLCDHNTSTLQTDRWKDRQLALAIPCYAILCAVR